MMTPLKLIALAAALLAVVVAGVAFWPSAEDGTDETAVSSLDVPFRYMDGTEANLADFAGQPLVVNFWASWCPACVAEMSDFAQVHADLEGSVVFLGLNMQETDPAAAEAIVAATGVTYLLGTDPDGAIFNSFGGFAMPTTVFIGPDGTVVNTHAGALFAEDLERIIRTELLDA